MNFIAFVVASLISIFYSVNAAQAMANVPAVLLTDGLWRLNVNYASAHTVQMYSMYYMFAECDTVVNIQELFCVGKSLNVSVTNMENTSDVRVFSVNANVTANCSMNVQDPDQASLIPQYAKASIVVPKGIYAINMNMTGAEVASAILGYRGFAIRSAISPLRQILASKCYKPNDINGPVDL